nr:hypothetical protein [uncultured Butyrivibrio sp.]
MADKYGYIQSLFAVGKPEMKKRLFSMIDFMEYACSGNEVVVPAGPEKEISDKFGDVICLTYRDGKMQDVYRFEDYDTRRWYILKNEKKIAVSDLVDEFDAISNIVMRDEEKHNPDYKEKPGNVASFLDFVNSFAGND